MTKYRTIGRAGFTAIEILIVVAIIALLMSIAAGAIIRVKAASERTATETTLTKLASMLDRHWKAVIDTAKKEYDGLPVNIKQNLLTLADNQAASATTPKPHPRRDDRARLLYVEFRLKQEFPSSIQDAIDPDRSFGNYLPASDFNTYLQGNAILTTAFSSRMVAGKQPPTTGKPAYVKFIMDFYTKVNAPPPGPGAQGISWANRLKYPHAKYQSAMLLVVALEQSRGGVAPSNMDQEIGTTFVPGGFVDPESKRDPPSKTITLPRYLADSWGGPLQLYIFPAYDFGTNEGTSDLDVTFTYSPTNKAAPPNQTLREKLQSGGGPDPMDPEGLLLNVAVSQWSPPAAVAAFLPHRQQMPQFITTSGNTVTFKMRRMVPTIVSAGPDGLIGVQNPAAMGDDAWSAQNPFMTFGNQAAFDNIFSFRQRQTGARGE